MQKLATYQGHVVPKGAERAWNRYASRARDMQPAVDLCPYRRTVVQAGGNIGAWPVWLASNFIEVITFEPEPTNFMCLTRNVAPYHNIAPHRVGLSDRDGSQSLSVQKSIGSHHLVDEPGETSVARLDRYNIEHLDLLVLDIEGWEYEALVGAQDTIARCRPVVMLEDRGHGVKKGTGSTFDDVLAQLPDYEIVHRVRHDVILVPLERT